MDLPLFGLGVAAGWIVLVVASDVFGILRIAPKRLALVQTGALILSIGAALGCGFLYQQERHAAPCPPARNTR
jgi:hypothetical protein